MAVDPGALHRQQRQITSYIPDIECYKNLQRRVALRYLEEAAALGQVNTQAIPFLIALLKDSQLIQESNNLSCLIKSSHRSLLLDVRIEAILMHVRAKPRDWQGFSQALDKIFPEGSSDARSVEMRKELLDLLQAQDREKKCPNVLENYNLAALQSDLLMYTSLEKASLRLPFLDQLLNDVFKGKYPLPDNMIGHYVQKESTEPNKETKTGSDDVGQIGKKRSSTGKETAGNELAKRSSYGKNEGKSPAKGVGYANDEGDISNEAKVVKGGGDHLLNAVNPRLRKRDQYGKVVTSMSPSKSARGYTSISPRGSVREVEARLLPVNIEGDVLKIELLPLGLDGHEESCHKCRGHGELLHCKGCPISVHAKCLNLDLGSQGGKDWFCPVCEEKKAAEVLARAKEEEMMARVRLAHFVGNKESCDPQPRMAWNSRVVDPGRSEKENQQENNVERRKSMEDESPEQIELSTRLPCSSSSAGLIKSLSGSNTRKSNDDRVIEGGATKVTSGKRVEVRVKVQEKVVENTAKACDIIVENATNEDAVTVSLEEKCEDRGNVQGDEGDGHDGDIEEDTERRNPIGHKKNWRKQKHTSRGNRIIPGIRRKRLPWLKEEEDILKEGVRKFSHGNGEWGFQWTRIVAFGQGVLHPSRTDGDLKDKWRNLSRGRA